MDELQEKIDDFLSRNDHQPLIFEDYEVQSEEFSLEKFTLKELLVKCGNITKKYRSVTEDGKLQCRNDKARSALDLWRHILYFHPQITFREILATLSNCSDVFYVCSCPDIKRRTFQLVGSLSGESPSYRGPDEFGLLFPEWKGF